MERFKTANIFNKRIYFYSVLLTSVTLIVPLIECEQSEPLSSQLATKLPEKISTKYKLKLCNGGTTNTNKSSSIENFIRIPSFSTIEKTYNLEEYEVDRNNPLESCPNGEDPLPLPVTVVAKADYDEEFEASNFSAKFRSELLWSKSFLFDIGFLSVGDLEKRTAEYYFTDEFCIENVHGENSRTIVDLKICPFSESRPRLRKCCPLGMIIGKTGCIGRNHSEKWDPGYMESESGKMLKIDKVNPVYMWPKLSCDFRDRESWPEDNCTYEFHPVTDNTIAFIGAYRSWEFLSSNTDWCIESMEYNENGEDRQRNMLFHCVGNETKSRDSDDKNKARISLLYMVTMYIGAFFHLLTTLVYLVTWTKQNIHGKTLCSCTVSLFFMQFFLGTAHLLGRNGKLGKTTICIINGIGGQYFMIAAFTWLIIVNFDLWRTFRSIRSEGGKGWKRLLLYSSIGWLFPFLVSSISVILDFSFPCRVSGVKTPEFGEYICFVAPWAQGPYVYHILGVLIAISCVFAVLTLASLYNAKKDAVNLRSTKSADDQQNVLLFLKLSVVMGLTWIFEVISWAATKENENHVGWIILDLYNSLSAILIFIIFVCKKTTLKLLEQSVPMLEGLTAAVSKLTSSIESTATTTSTVSGGNVHQKRSIDSQDNGPVVRYKKEKEKEESVNTGNGSTNKAFEQS